MPIAIMRVGRAAIGSSLGLSGAIFRWLPQV
jgi:hypothetical protein